MNCSNCGSPVDGSMPFCTKCGAKLNLPQQITPEQANLGKKGDFEKASAVDSGLDKMFSKFPVAGSKSSKGAAKVQYNQAGLLTNSLDIDTSQVKREFTSHRYTNLGGFLGFIVYAGFAGIIAGAIAAIVIIVSKVLSIIGIAQYDIASSIPAILMAIIDLLLFMFFAYVSILMGWRTFKKIKNKEIDFIQYAIKGIIWFTMLYLVYFFVDALMLNIMAQYLPWVDPRNIGETILTLVGVVVVMLAVTGIIIAYFVSSSRVRTYLGTDAYFQVCPITRNATAPIPEGGKVKMNKTNASSDYIAKQGYAVRTVPAQPVTPPQQPTTIPSQQNSTPVAAASVFCPNCGSQAPAGSKFCKQCGNRLG